jgi:hypothetical protein
VWGFRISGSFSDFGELFADFGDFGISVFRDFGVSDVRYFGISVFRGLGKGISARRRFGISGFRDFGTSGLRVFGVWDARTAHRRTSVHQVLPLGAQPTVNRRPVLHAASQQPIVGWLLAFDSSHCTARGSLSTFIVDIHTSRHEDYLLVVRAT